MGYGNKKFQKRETELDFPSAQTFCKLKKLKDKNGNTYYMGDLNYWFTLSGRVMDGFGDDDNKYLVIQAVPKRAVEKKSRRDDDDDDDEDEAPKKKKKRDDDEEDEDEEDDDEDEDAEDLKDVPFGGKKKKSKK